MRRDTAYPVFEPYWIYVIQEHGDADICKIGVARKPEYRLSDMQAGNPRPLSISYMHEVVGRSAAHRIEFAVHAALKENRIRGEWFSVSADIAVSTIKKYGSAE